MRFVHITRAKIPTTNWSLIARAGVPGEMQRKALESLVVSYRPALVSFLVFRHRVEPEMARDLVQGFILERVLEKNLLVKADREKGKFRNFLLTSVQNYMRDAFRKSVREREIFTDLGVHLEHIGDLAGGEEDPAVTFERLFAQNVVRVGVSKMEAACRESGRVDLWMVFDGRLVRSALEGEEPVSYEELVTTCGFENPTKAMAGLVTAKRMFVRVLQGVVAQYVESESEIDVEIGRLMSALGKNR